MGENKARGWLKRLTMALSSDKLSCYIIILFWHLLNLPTHSIAEDKVTIWLKLQTIKQPDTLHGGEVYGHRFVGQQGRVC